MNINRLPPLSLYIHIPWCVQKCPYCDFNSHAQKGHIPEQDYIAHLLQDLHQDRQRFQDSIQDRSLHSIFIGGGRLVYFLRKEFIRSYLALHNVSLFNLTLKLRLKLIPVQPKQNVSKVMSKPASPAFQWVFKASMMIN